MNTVTTISSAAALEYAGFLRDLHALFVQGEEEGEDAESVRDQMDGPWYAMTAQERDRVRGLSEDLYALAEGGPPCVEMTDGEVNTWKKELEARKNRYLQGDIDAWLGFWRKPRPNNFPPPNGIPLAVIHFSQAQCWEKLDDYETAAFFRKAAENLVMEQLTRVA